MPDFTYGQIAKMLDLEEMFLLDLRKGRKAMAAVPGEEKERPIMEVDLDAVLPQVAGYEPAQFQKRFREIAALLK